MDSCIDFFCGVGLFHWPVIQSKPVISVLVCHAYLASYLPVCPESEHKFGKLVFEIFLDGALQWPGSEITVISLFGNEVACLVRKLKTEAEFLDSGEEVAELDVDDAEDCIASLSRGRAGRT